MKWRANRLHANEQVLHEKNQSRSSVPKLRTRFRLRSLRTVLILVDFHLVFLFHRLLLLILVLILLATFVSHGRFLSKLSNHRIRLFKAAYYGRTSSYCPELAFLRRP